MTPYRNSYYVDNFRYAVLDLRVVDTKVLALLAAFTDLFGQEKANFIFITRTQVRNGRDLAG